MGNKKMEKAKDCKGCKYFNCDDYPYFNEEKEVVLNPNCKNV